MWTISVFILVVAVNSWTDAADPSACHKAIKYMLITACGATKRHSQLMPRFRVMDDWDMEKQYTQMVKWNMILGVEEDPGYSNSLDEKDGSLYQLHQNSVDATEDALLYRWKRDLLGLGMSKDKPFAEPIAHERRGSFSFISRVPTRDEDRSPLPNVLKAKCCGGPYLCTMDDFKGFCG